MNEEVEEAIEVAPEGVDPALWLTWHNEEEVKKDKFLWELNRGIKGLNVGLGNGMPVLNKYIYGTHKARYYLIGGESKAGKTTIGDFMYVLNAWLAAKKRGKRIKIFYFSFEMGRVDKIFKWVSYFIFIKFGVRLPAEYCHGKIDNNVPGDTHVKMILTAYTIVLEMMKDVTIIEESIHPTGIFESLIHHHFEKNGTVARLSVTAEEKKKGKLGYVTGYTEDDPDLITIAIIDHLALANGEMGLATKGVMDKVSKYMIVLRNLFYATPVLYQQFSTDMMATYRGQFGKKNELSVVPNRLDFGDSKATFRDADVVLGLVKPFNELKKFHGYDLSIEDGMGNYFTALYVMKHRYGPDNRMVPLFIEPISGVPYDLPSPLNPFAMKEWNELAQKIDAICLTYSPREKSP